LLFPSVLTNLVLWHSSAEVEFHRFISDHWSRFQLSFFTQSHWTKKRSLQLWCFPKSSGATLQWVWCIWGGFEHEMRKKRSIASRIARL